MRLYSKLSEYAIRALVILAQNGMWRLSVEKICELGGLPVHFTRKALQTLSRKHYLDSARGPAGGYRLKPDPGKIRLYDIVRLFDDVEMAPDCPIGYSHCSVQKPCKLRSFILKFPERIHDSFRRITIGDLAEKFNKKADT